MARNNTGTQSVMNHNFSRVPSAEIQRSSFDRSHGNKTTFNAGYLVPIFVDEALPGDTFSLNLTGLARLATPLHPFMDNLFMNTFFFAVPYRLVWDNWQKFNGEQIDPGDSTDYVIPQMVAPEGGYANGSISDYFGLPTLVAGFSHSALFHRAYNLVWNEWFRDQNLQDSLTVSRGDGPDDPSAYILMRRGKRHDYFTSALPWPQKGPAVPLPLGGYAPIIGLGMVDTAAVNTSLTALETSSDSVLYPRSSPAKAGGTNSGLTVRLDDTSGYRPDIYADLEDTTATTINQLRQAFQIQKLYERDARGGTRYAEILKAHFGVTSPDARLQRPEYLGGGQSPVNLHTVPQTSAASGQPTPQGNLSAYGTSHLSGHGFTKSFTEHCLIIGLVSVRADLTYQQGLNRMWTRNTRWDFYWPALAHLGEQAVLNKEIYTQGTSADDDVFGYQERFAEYRYKPSQITGEFRSNFAQSLDTWHLSQDFGSLPVLNDEFIQDNPPIERVIAVSSSPHFIFDSYVQLRTARPMPVFSVPGLIDHF